MCGVSDAASPRGGRGRGGATRQFAVILYLPFLFQLPGTPPMRRDCHATGSMRGVLSGCSVAYFKVQVREARVAMQRPDQDLPKT